MLAGPQSNQPALASIDSPTVAELAKTPTSAGGADRVGTIQFRPNAGIARWPRRRGHPSSLLTGARILVVEDDYMIATDLACAIEEAGASVIGPAANIASARQLIEQGGGPSAAILDIRLDCELVYTIADTLLESGIPWVFYSAFECVSLPARFEGTRFVCKALAPSEAVRVLQMEVALERADCRDLLADAEPGESVIRITVALFEIARNLTGDHEAASILVEKALNQALECSAMRPAGITTFRWLLEMIEDAWMSGRWRN